MMPPTICLVTAIYNDWPAFGELLKDIEAKFGGQGALFDVIVVDDGSTAKSDRQYQDTLARGLIRSVTILELRANCGNQCAVAVGLRYAAEHRQCDAVLLMDADGEDRPDDARRLIAAWQERPDTIAVGRRTKRSESSTFKLFYFFYRTVFRVLTGHDISFGNFSAIPAGLLHAVAYRPELPHHYSATILRTRLPITYVATARGRRYTGESHMNMPGLVFHALSGLSVFSAVLFSRLLIAAAAIVTLCGIGIVCVAVLRIFTALAFPNWATTVIAFLALLASQAILLILSSGFILLMGRWSMLQNTLEMPRAMMRIRIYGAPALRTEA